MLNLAGAISAPIVLYQYLVSAIRAHLVRRLILVVLAAGCATALCALAWPMTAGFHLEQARFPADPVNAAEMAVENHPPPLIITTLACRRRSGDARGSPSISTIRFMSISSRRRWPTWAFAGRHNNPSGVMIGAVVTASRTKLSIPIAPSPHGYAASIQTIPSQRDDRVLRFYRGPERLPADMHVAVLINGRRGLAKVVPARSESSNWTKTVELPDFGTAPWLTIEVASDTHVLPGDTRALGAQLRLLSLER